MRLELLGECRQIKDLLAEKYGQNYLELIRIEYDPNCTSIQQYLKGNVLKNLKFKSFLVDLLGKPYDTIVMTYKQQLIDALQSIRENLTADLEIIDFKEQKNICRSNKYHLLYDYILSIEAMLLFANGRRDEAYIKFSENDFNTFTNEGKMINQCEYAQFLILGRKYNQAFDILESIDIDKAEVAYTKYRYYQASGMLYKSDPYEKFTKARSFFLKAAAYAPSGNLKGASIGNAALMCREKKEYDKAISYFNEAYESFESEDAKLIALNNIARVQHYKGFKSESRKTILEVIERINTTNKASDRYAILYNYLDIMGSNYIASVLGMITNANFFAYQDRLENIFKLLIEKATNTKELDGIERKLMDLYRVSADTDDIKSILEKCLGKSLIKRQLI